MFENHKRKRQVAKWVSTQAFESSLDPECSICVTDADVVNGLTRFCFADAVLQMTLGEQATVTLPFAMDEIGRSPLMGELFFRLEEWQTEYEGAFKAALAEDRAGTDIWAEATEAGSFELAATLAVLKRWARRMLAETRELATVTAGLGALARLRHVPGVTLAGDVAAPVIPLAFTLAPAATAALADLEAAYTGDV
ncbi:hypothetical protein [Lacticaseibacillus absianus]|uniref:hypothetical protein n=1 Tax=Lacticaseibacillus absianus TaxID=2729623 RepID=UPI0015C8EB61|nr:hypothetical protein [Lacticaseibacillus absianus]